MITGIPEAVFWAVGAISVVLGLLLIIRRERIARCLRWWLIRQLRWVRTPGYHTCLRINGWLLIVLGTLMLLLMMLVRGR